MKRINIENPKRIEYFVSKSVTSWRIEYIGQGEDNDIYYYNLIHKDNPNNSLKSNSSLHSPKIAIHAIHIEIYTQTQQLYNPDTFQLLDNEWVKIRLIHPLKKDVIKFIRVEEFKDMRRVFNTLHDAGRQLMQ
jgi:hypothetical protein